MKFELTKPCKDCPFRTDCLKGWLGRGRAIEIAHSLTALQQSFPCHKTTEETGNPKNGEQHCAGALIMLEHMEKPNQMMRIAERLRFYDRFKLKMSAPVFTDTDEFIDHHTHEKKRRSTP